MTRIRTKNDGVVHFAHPVVGELTLCCKPTVGRDLLEEPESLAVETSQPITCKHCAKVFCAVKNQTLGGNVFEDEALDYGILNGNN